MKNKVLLIAGSVSLLSLWSQASFAVCKLQSSKYVAQNVVMDIGRITLDPNVKVGENYYTGKFAIQSKANLFKCDWRGGKAIGIIQSGNDETKYKNVFATNIKGIGVRLYRDSGSIQTYYPHEIKNGSNASGDLAGGTFKVDIVRTDAITGTGALSGGLYSTYYYDGDGPSKPILTSTLNAEGIVLINPTCSIDDQSRYQNIEMGGIRASQLKNVGDTLNEKDFKIKLICNGGNVQVQKVKLGFSYLPDAQAGNYGVIANKKGVEYAQGIGIQLSKADDKTSVTNGRSVDMGTTTLHQETYPELKLKARYYKTNTTLLPGKVFATTTFNIEYQ